MKNIFKILLVGLIAVSCVAQSYKKTEKVVGGPCEDCEALLDFQKLGITPKPIDTLPDFPRMIQK